MNRLLLAGIFIVSAILPKGALGQTAIWAPTPLALLIQDPMGDFDSAMLFTSGIFGLGMYLAGIIAIYFYKFLLPLEEDIADLEPVTE